MAIKYPYTVIRKPRRRSVTLSVSPRNHLTVTVPKHFSDSHIEKFLAQQAGWIAKKILRNQNLGAQYPPKAYQDGDVFSFLGQSYRLEIEERSPRSVKIEGDRLRVSASRNIISGDGEDDLPSMVRAWYEGTAHSILKERVAYYEEKMELRAQSIRVRTLAAQWGSCAITGHLCFNARLIMAPLNIVDYVVVHELSHLAHHNHSPRFWKLVESHIPDYRKCRKWLREHGNFLTF